MPADGDLYAAVAAGVLATEDAHRELLQSIVEVARGIFRAQAASIFLFDEPADELVFEAIAGEGSRTLVGRRFPSSTGIAGWVLVTRQPVVLEDVASDPRFGREAAESTGYVPRALMAVPLLHEERTLGVLEVLDREESEFTLQEMELLGRFANEAAIALDLLQRARGARRILLEAEEELRVVGRVSAALDALEGERRQAGMQLLRALEDVLAGR